MHGRHERLIGDIGDMGDMGDMLLCELHQIALGSILSLLIVIVTVSIMLAIDFVLTSCCLLILRLGTEHIAWSILLREDVRGVVPQIDGVWVCDSSEAPQKWLRQVLPHGSVPILDDINIRSFKKNNQNQNIMIARDIDGNKFQSTTGDVDLYIAGFPCNPWSSRGPEMKG